MQVMNAVRYARARQLTLAAALLLVSCEASSGRDDLDDDVDASADVSGDANVDSSDDGGADDTSADSSPDAESDVPADAPTDALADGDTDMGVDVGAPPYWPETGLTLIDLDGDGYGTASGSFTDGTPLSSVEWMRSPDVACFSNPINDEFFIGPHLAYALADTVPEWSEVKITVTPDSNVESNLYILQQGPDRYDVPTDVTDVEYCYVPTRRGSIGEPAVYTFRTYGGEARNIFFGVSNRDRRAQDRTASFEVEVQVSPLSGTDQCYTGIEGPAQWPDAVNRISVDENGEAVFLGNLNQGAPTCDVEFIDDAFCAPDIRFDLFRGNHVFYGLEGGIPDHSILSITVTPDPGVDVNLYGASQGTTTYYTPPFFPLTICEASFDPWFRNPGEPETIVLNAVNNPFNIFFAVAGDVTQAGEGGYTISIQLISTSTDDCSDDDYDAVTGLTAWPDDVQLIDVEDGFGSITADLANGSELCTLDWASNSSTACFPATENDHFGGNHRFFVLSEPPPATSNVYITVIPDQGVDVNAYAFRLGVDRVVVPPFVPSVGQCEASYPFALGTPPDPGVIEVLDFYNPGSNQYNYFIGVAGYADGLNEGSFTIEVEIEEPPPPHCPESLPGATYPTWPTSVELVALDDSGQGGTSGDLSAGSCVNLDFAESSQVACFPATRFDRFEGNHNYYALAQTMPPHSELTITATPDAGVEVNLWGIQAGTTSFPVPPAVYTAICEASYALNGDPNPGEAESIFFSNPTDNEYNIFFAVAGDDETGTSGGYDIDLQLNVGVVHCEESLPGPSGLSDWPDDMDTVVFDDGGEFSVTGDLSDGDCTNLEFAESSQVACFPATQFWHYEGNHVMFGIDEVLPPNSFLTITAQPDPEVDISLYGMQQGDVGFPSIPPNVSSTICEASNAWREPNPGEPESILFQNPTENEYHIFFAVAGNGDSGTSGGFEVSGHLTVGETHCTESLPGRPYDAWPTSVTLIDVDGDGTALVTGDLSDGDCVNLDFAQSSNVACFTAVDFDSYEGNHVYYALSDITPVNSHVTVSVESTGDTDINVYGYRIGTNSFYVPPYVPGGTCEYRLASDDVGPATIEFDNPGGNQYNIFFAVAGDDTTGTSGSYEISVEITDIL